MRGGYAILDLSGETFVIDEVSDTIPGIFQKVKSLMFKPIIITGLQIGLNKYSDFYVLFIDDDTSIYAQLPTATINDMHDGILYSISIFSNDTVGIYSFPIVPEE